MANVQGTMLRNAGERTREIDQEINGLESNKDNFEQGNENTTNLHTRELQRPEGDEILLTNEVTTVLEGAAPRFTLISQTIGDFTMREVDTRVKQRPTQADINNINLVVSEIVNREQQQHSINPNRKPFEYLWMINCILYAVIVAFLFYKKWKKPAETKGQKERKTQSQKMKDAYIAKATELRRKISIAKAELERIKANKKMSKKGKKNRAMLENDCGKVTLVTYMEKKKSDVRKLKRCHYRKQKQEESKVLNGLFQADPGSVYSSFNEMIKEEKDNTRPKYKTPQCTTEGTERQMFENIDEASSYWKLLWEQSSTSISTTRVSWLNDVKRGFDKLLPAPPADFFQLSTEASTKVIKQKRNWSAPGPDRLTNFWWKKATCLHQGIATCFAAIGN